MYISDKRTRIKVPDSYSGNAIRDAEALRIAEEAFNRGYVFEACEDASEELDVPDYIESEPLQASDVYAEETAIEAPEEAAMEVSSAPNTEEIAVHTGARGGPPPRRGGIGDIIDLILSENVIILALIFVLWQNGTDDGLLLMLAILFFC